MLKLDEKQENILIFMRQRCMHAVWHRVSVICIVEYEFKNLGLEGISWNHIAWSSSTTGNYFT